MQPTNWLRLAFSWLMLGWAAACAGAADWPRPAVFVRYDQPGDALDGDVLDADLALFAGAGLQPILDGELLDTPGLLRELLRRCADHDRAAVLLLTTTPPDAAAVASEVDGCPALLALAVPAATPPDWLAAWRAAAPEIPVWAGAGAPTQPAGAFDGFGPFAPPPPGEPLPPADIALPQGAGLPWLGGWLGGGQRGAVAARLARHELIETLAAGGRGVVLPCSWTQLVGRTSALAPAGMANLSLLAEVIAAAGQPLERVAGAPANLTVLVSADGAAVLYREREGRSAEQLLSGPPSTTIGLWPGGVTRAAAAGWVLAVPVAPFCAGATRRVAVLAAAGSVEARCSSDLLAPLALTVRGAPSGNLTLLAPAGSDLWVTVAGRATEALRADADGRATVPLPDSDLVLVRVADRPPAGDTPSPAEFLQLAESYVAAGEPGRATAELERLMDRHPGTDVAALAAARRAELMADSAVLVLVNHARDPLQLRLEGPTPWAGELASGEQRMQVIQAGDYRHTAFLPALQPLESGFRAGRGQVVFREFGRTSSPRAETIDPAGNLRGPLTDTEMRALAQVAADLLPSSGPRPGAPSGARPTRPGGLTGPPLNLVAEVNARQAGSGAGATSVTIRNLTQRDLDVHFIHWRPLPLTPNTFDFRLRRGSRRRQELVEGGTFSARGVVPENNQEIGFRVTRCDGRAYELVFRELPTAAAPK